MFNPIVIHNNNIGIDDFQQISFDTNENVDKSIADLLSQIDKDYKYDLIIIKDSLSKNYLDFYGLLLVHHIRLTNNFRGQYFPIVIVSDLNLLQINKLTSLARILFTQGVYLVDNNFNSIKNLLKKSLTPINKGILIDDFLEKTSIEPPSNYESSHSIANEWSIYQWSNALIGIEGIVNDTDNMLYFKYLKTKYPVEANSKFSTKELVKDLKGKVLYIDDEWEKGWSEILENILKLEENYKYLDSINKETSKDDIKELAIEKVKSCNPDVVLLDLRLHDSDFIKDNPKKLTGIKLLKSIKAINKGIQVIIFTASEKSLILEEALSLGALGYIKKEHPDSYNLSTQENISNLVKLVSNGFNRKYLKDIWNTRASILLKLETDPFSKFITNKDTYEEKIEILISETRFIFDVLNSETDNKLNYAAISMVTWLDALQQVFITKKQDAYLFWDETDVYNSSSLKSKILSILKQKMNHTDTDDIDAKLEKYIEKRNYYAHSNPKYVSITSSELKDFFTILNKIIDMILFPDEKKNPKPIKANSKFKIKNKKSLE